MDKVMRKLALFPRGRNSAWRSTKVGFQPPASPRRGHVYFFRYGAPLVSGPIFLSLSVFISWQAPRAALLAPPLVPPVVLYQRGWWDGQRFDASVDADIVMLRPRMADAG